MLQTIREYFILCFTEPEAYNSIQRRKKGRENGYKKRQMAEVLIYSW